MDWSKFEKRGWSWSVGWSSSMGGYYARAWRDLPRRIQVEGRWIYRECLTEGGRDTLEAEAKLQQRLEDLG